MKQRHAKQRRRLERRPKAHAQVATLYLVNGPRSDADPLRELQLRPAPPPPREPDLGAKQRRRDDPQGCSREDRQAPSRP